MFHLGAHCTDDGLLIRSILKNRASLAKESVGVPGPGRYRELIREISADLRGRVADQSTEAEIIEAIRDDETATRIVLSSDDFLCRPDAILGDDGLYPMSQTSAWLRQSVPSHAVEFSLSIRNPASFVPEVLDQIGLGEEALDDVSIGDLMWSDVIADIAVANPGCRIVVWCHEDAPLLWSDIIQEVSGHDLGTEIDGAFDMLSRIMSADGMSRLVEFLAKHPSTSPSQRRRAISAFLEAHAIEAAMVTPIDLPGWTEETVATLTEAYEDDVRKIRTMPEVTFLTP